MGAPEDFSSVTVSRKAPGLFGHEATGPTVVWLRGEHDISNASRLSQALSEVIALDQEDVVIDLSGVEFMSGGTVALFFRANSFLGARGRSLTLRAPRPATLRLLGICDLAHLVHPPPGESVQMTATSDALRSWVVVPASARADQVESTPPAQHLVEDTSMADEQVRALPVDAE